MNTAGTEKIKLREQKFSKYIRFDFTTDWLSKQSNLIFNKNLTYALAGFHFVYVSKCIRSFRILPFHKYADLVF